MARTGDADVDDNQPGDDEFRQLFTNTYSPLVAYARRRTSSSGEADDIVSEVYATAWRRRHELDPARAPLPWLYGIAGNVVRNQWRSSARRLKLAERLDAQPQPTSKPVDASHEVRAALAQLPFDDQELLRLVAWEGLSHGEVATVLGCSTNAIGIRMHRARQRLSELLEPTTDATQGLPR
jgi:RNA polymerase sigma-70 factor, ECF subfamily